MFVERGRERERERGREREGERERESTDRHTDKDTDSKRRLEDVVCSRQTPHRVTTDNEDMAQVPAFWPAVFLLPLGRRGRR